MPHAYILRCADGTFYTGSTVDLARRLHEHHTGDGANYTRERRPVVLVWSIECDRIDDAFAIEKRLQKWSHAKKQAVVDGRFGDLPALSRSRVEPPTGSGNGAGR